MTNEEYKQQEQRYKKLKAKYYSDAKMTPEEILEYLELDEIFGPVEE